MFQRTALSLLYKRINEPRKFIQAILGPRQIGKTTLVKQLTEKIKQPWLFASADAIDSSNSVWIEQQWDNIRLKLKSSKAKSAILIIDEIQKIDNWSEIIKKEWDKDSFNDISIKLIILGSARLILQKGLTESLAGRYEIVPMGHWSFSEMHEAFGLSADQYVWFGGYPGSAALIKDENRWRDYLLHSLIETTISKDILMLARIDKPALLKRLFEIGCAYSGQILSYTKMIGQLHDAGNTTTLAHYLNLLDSAGLLSGLEKYTSEKFRQRASMPKWQVQNSALFSTLSGKSFNEVRTNPAIWGRHVESAIGAHLINSCREKNIGLYYWREQNAEVDFVLEKKGKLIGLEVKSGATQKAPGMEAFKKTFKTHKTYLVGNSGILWQEFLKTDPDDLF